MMETFEKDIKCFSLQLEQVIPIKKGPYTKVKYVLHKREKVENLFKNMKQVNDISLYLNEMLNAAERNIKE